MSILEWIAFVTNVICVALIVFEADINWPIGVLGSAALLAVFWRTKLYAQVGLQFFYIIECLYGWWMWTRRDQNTGGKLIRIGKTRFHLAIALTAISVGATAGLCVIFRRTGDPAPLADSAITAASLAAEYMLCLKLYESWVVYLLADLASLVVFAFLAMWITFATYGVFTALCISGIIVWRQKMLRSTEARDFAVIPLSVNNRSRHF
jgi:nicotinamide mononucleotide transporter